ncbi:uncharacterized protein LOC131884784 [Tigriopus californicus]|uniref:uncharacterized protein LOC131884784 n=1 Tax=Tigriopus californicus TaxID=6832 RepID=UPI0027D9E7CD|nr:uncharacterized protein LOC131884784 [Tigriopus californicus]
MSCYREEGKCRIAKSVAPLTYETLICFGCSSNGLNHVNNKSQRLAFQRDFLDWLQASPGFSVCLCSRCSRFYLSERNDSLDPEEEVKAKTRRGRPPVRRGISTSLFFGRARHKLRYTHSSDEEDRHGQTQDKRFQRKKVKLRKEVKRKKSKKRHKSKKGTADESRLQIDELCLPILSRTLQLSEEDEDHADEVVDGDNEGQAKRGTSRDSSCFSSGRPLCLPKLAYSTSRSRPICLGIVRAHLESSIVVAGSASPHNCMMMIGRVPPRSAGDINQIICHHCNVGFASYSKHMDHLRYSSCGIRQQRMNDPHQGRGELYTNFPTNPEQPADRGPTTYCYKETQANLSQKDPFKSSSTSLSSGSRVSNRGENHFHLAGLPQQQQHQRCYINDPTSSLTKGPSSSSSSPALSSHKSRVSALNNFVQQHSKKDIMMLPNAEGTSKKRKLSSQGNGSGAKMVHHERHLDWNSTISAQAHHRHPQPFEKHYNHVEPIGRNMWPQMGYGPGPHPQNGHFVHQAHPHAYPRNIAHWHSLHGFRALAPSWQRPPGPHPMWSNEQIPYTAVLNPHQWHPPSTSYEHESPFPNLHNNPQFFNRSIRPRHLDNAPQRHGYAGFEERASGYYSNADGRHPNPGPSPQYNPQVEPPPRPSSDEDVIRAAAEVIARENGQLIPEAPLTAQTNHESLFNEICNEAPLEAPSPSEHIDFHEGFTFDDLGGLNSLMSFVHTDKEKEHLRPPDSTEGLSTLTEWKVRNDLKSHEDQSNLVQDDQNPHASEPCLKEGSRDPILTTGSSSSNHEGDPESLMILGTRATLFDFPTTDTLPSLERVFKASDEISSALPSVRIQDRSQNEIDESSLPCSNQGQRKGHELESAENHLLRHGSSKDVSFLEQVFQRMKYERLAAQSRYAIARILGEEDSLKLDLMSNEVPEVLDQYLAETPTKTIEDMQSSLGDPVLPSRASGSNFERLHEVLKANIGRFLDLVLPESQECSQVERQGKSVEEILEILCQPKSEVEEEEDTAKLVSTSDGSAADSTTKLFSIQKNGSESGVLEHDEGDEMVDPQDEIITNEELPTRSSGSVSKLTADIARSVFVDANGLRDFQVSSSTE